MRANLSNEFASFQAGGAGTDDATGSQGSLHSLGGSGGCATGSDVYMADMSYAVIPGEGNTFTFTIAGGQAGSNYDVFATAQLALPLTNAVWTWLGQGTNCGIYAVTNQSAAPTYYLLGNATPAGASGFSLAYEHFGERPGHCDTTFEPDEYTLEQRNIYGPSCWKIPAYLPMAI